MIDADWAREVVQEFRADRAAAARLALLASLAVEIDASLLRVLRQTLMREAEPGIEADVWFSPLVEAHDAESCVLHEPILLELRRQLSEDAALFSEVAALTRRAHREWPAAVLLEEQLTELGYGSPPNLAESLERALKPALRSLTSDDEARALEVARWALRAWPRFHASLRAEPIVQSLVIGAALRLERPKLPLEADERAVSAQDLGWLVPQHTLSLANEVGLSLQPRGLRFVSPKASGVRLAVPGTRPAIVSLRWGGAEGKRRLVEAIPGVRVELPQATTEIEITTLSGDHYVLSRVEEEPKAAAWVETAAPSHEQRRRLMQAIQAAGALVGPGGESWVALAIHLESDLWMTPGRPGSTTLVEAWTARQFRVLSSSDDGVIVLRTTEATALSENEGLGAFIATDIELEQLGSESSLPLISAEICIPASERVAQVRNMATVPSSTAAIVSRFAAGTLEVAVDARIGQLPPVGALVVANDRIVGMLVSDRASASTPRWLAGVSGEWRVLNAVTAQTMRREWQRHRTNDPSSSASVPNAEDAPAPEATAPAKNQPIDWLSLLPKPRPRVGVDGQPIEWDVFLSYRSADRSWALGLYDVLTAAGFRVFFDQFNMGSGRDMLQSLQEAVSQSASAVVVFSKASTNSDWVTREINTLESIHVARQRSASPFYVVFAKLDSTELPMLFQNRLYVDFSNDLESGPGGQELVRLVHGLVGQPLSEEALRAAAMADELAKRMLAEISALNASGRFREIVELIKSDAARLETPLIAGAAARALISGRSYPEALDVLQVARSSFPRSVRLRQLEGLALRRMGRIAEAQEVLAPLYAEGHRDPETLGIYAATWMARYNETQDRKDLERSRDLYREAYEISPHDEYVGINAASKSALLGELDLARELAQRVVTRVQISNEDDFYGSLTFAEGLVILGSYEQAARLYEKARLRNPTRTGDLASTAAQLEALLPALDVPEESAHRLRNAVTGTE